MAWLIQQTLRQIVRSLFSQPLATKCNRTKPTKYHQSRNNQTNIVPQAKDQRDPQSTKIQGTMERQPREQAFIPERVERNVIWINRNGFFILVLAMWALGIIHEFLGLLYDGFDLLVLFLPLGFSLHSFNNALFPAQDASTDETAASKPWSQWIPILSIIVFINSAFANPSRTKLHVVVCVITMLLGFGQNLLENVQGHLPLALVHSIHFFIVATHFNIWYYTFMIVRREQGAERGGN